VTAAANPRPGVTGEGAPGRVYTITVLQPAWGPVSSAWLNANGRVHWAHRARTTKGWRENARSACFPITYAVVKPALDRAHIVATLHFGDDRKRDVGNYAPTVKAVIDGLVDAGMIPDDNDDHLIGPDLRRGDANGQPRIVLTVTEVPS
jgi:crossover junction endodeoxyribonuclease RusA